MKIVLKSYFYNLMCYPEPRNRCQGRYGIYEITVTVMQKVYFLQNYCNIFSDMDSRNLRKMFVWIFYQLRESGVSSYSYFRHLWSLKLKSPNIAKNRAGWIVCTLHWWVLKMGLHTFVSHLLIAFLLQTQYPGHGGSTGYISPLYLGKFLK